MKCDFAVATGVTGDRDKREVRSTVCVALMDRTSLAGTCDVGLIRTERARVCVCVMHATRRRHDASRHGARLFRTKPNTARHSAE